MSGARVTYPPLDVLKPVTDGVWIVDSGPHRMMGMPLPVRMTVVRLANNDLWLHSPTRFDTSLKREMDRLGRIKHLVAPNSAHWSFLKDWQRNCPDAVTWAPPGLRKRTQVKKSGVKLNHDLAETAPKYWADEIEQVTVPGEAGLGKWIFSTDPRAPWY